MISRSWKKGYNYTAANVTHSLSPQSCQFLRVNVIPLQAQQPHEPTVTAKKQPNFTSWPVSVHLHNCSSLRHQSLSLSVLVSMRTVKQTCTQLSPLKAGSSYNYMNCPQCFTKLQEDWPDSSNILVQHFEASQLSACEGIFRKTSVLLVASDWLVWTSTRSWRHVTEWANNWLWHTLQHAIFIMLSCFDHSMSGVTVK